MLLLKTSQFKKASKQPFFWVTATIWVHTPQKWYSIQLWSQDNWLIFLHSTKKGCCRAVIVLFTNQAFPSVHWEAHTLLSVKTNFWLSLQTFSATYWGTATCSRGLVWLPIYRCTMLSQSLDTDFMVLSTLNLAQNSSFKAHVVETLILEKNLGSTSRLLNSGRQRYSSMPMIARSISFFWLEISLFHWLNKLWKLPSFIACLLLDNIIAWLNIISVKCSCGLPSPAYTLQTSALLFLWLTSNFQQTSCKTEVDHWTPFLCHSTLPANYKLRLRKSFLLSIN